MSDWSVLSVVPFYGPGRLSRAHCQVACLEEVADSLGAFPAPLFGAQTENLKYVDQHVRLPRDYRDLLLTTLLTCLKGHRHSYKRGDPPPPRLSPAVREGYRCLHGTSHRCTH